MRMAEDFARCKKCDQAYFEKKEFVLIHEDSPNNKKPEINKTLVHYECINCKYAQYEYIEEA